MANKYGYTEEGLKHYTCHRAAGPIDVDGRLDEESWQLVPRSPRFEWIEEAGARTCPGWAWSSHGYYDSHIPDRFTFVHFSETVVGEKGARRDD